MKKRSLICFAGLLGIAALAAFATRSSWMGGGASAQGPPRARVISVELTKAERKRLEKRLRRKPGLEKWAIEIPPPPPDQAIT